jgi:hypothetical protein
MITDTPSQSRRDAPSPHGDNIAPVAGNEIARTPFGESMSGHARRHAAAIVAVSDPVVTPIRRYTSVARPSHL